MHAAERIFVRGVNWLGDAVMSTPALQRLREAKPAAHITLLTAEKLADLWRGHPSIDEVMTFRNDALFRTAQRLRAENFNAGLAFPNSFRSAFEMFFAGIPVRVGYARGARGIFLTHRLSPRAGAVRMHKRSRAEILKRIEHNAPRETFSASAHHAHDYLQLVAALGANPAPLRSLLHINDAEIAAARARFRIEPGTHWIALNPGAEYGPAKRWPVERFIEAAVKTHHALPCAWAIVGGAGDRELAERAVAGIREQIPQAHIRNLAGETTLRELCAVLKSCALLLTNDTGPMHVAAALGTSVVVPFGSTSPEMTGPGVTNGTLHQVLIGGVPCAPCFRRECPIDFRCMKAISVEQVVTAVARVLQGGAGFV
jgi:heptosyltransferase-2